MQCSRCCSGERGTGASVKLILLLARVRRRGGGCGDGREGGSEPEIAAKVDSDGRAREERAGRLPPSGRFRPSPSVGPSPYASIHKQRTNGRASCGRRADTEGTEGRRRHDILGKHSLSLSPHSSSAQQAITVAAGRARFSGPSMAIIRCNTHRRGRGRERPRQ